MRPLKVRHTVDAPREDVYAYLCDVANYQEFCDHLFGEMRLERLDSRGLGAAFRFRLKFPPARWWGDLVLTELRPHHTISAEGRMGRIGRVPIEAQFTLTTAGHGLTKVEFRFQSHPTHPKDRLHEALGMRSWMKLHSRRALHRLARVAESGQTTAPPISAAAG